MKDIYSILSFFLLFLAGTMTASAQYRQADYEETSIAAGKKYLLQNGEKPTTIQYLSTDASNKYYGTKVDETTIMEFESAGNIDGEDCYYIKNPATNTYIIDLDNLPENTFTTTFTDDKTKALVVSLSETQTQDESQVAFHMKRHKENAGFVLYFVPKTPYGAGGPGYGMIYPNFMYFSSWLIYAVEEIGGKEKLGVAIDQYTPNGVEGVWQVGSGPGCISQEIFDELLSAYNTAMAIYDKDAPTSQECDEATDRLTTAYKTAISAINPVTEGYYYISNINDDLLYVVNDGSSSLLYCKDYEIPDSFDIASAPYIWHITPSEEPGYFNIVNLLAEKAISSSLSNGAQTLTNDKSLYGNYKFSYQADNYSCRGGVFNILNLWGNKAMLTLDTRVGYADSPDPKSDEALFKLISVSEQYIEDIEKSKEQEALNEELTALYIKTATKVEKTKSYNSTVATSGTLDTPGLITNVSTNAQEPTEGNVEFAIDKDLYTYFHSNWSSAETAPDVFHFLDVQLETPVKTFAVKMVRRYFTDLENSANLNPMLYNLYATNDSTGEWTRIGTYATNFNRGVAPEEYIDDIANLASINYIEMPAAYKYLRFEVIRTKDNGTINGLPYFNLSEIGVYTAEYLSESSAYETLGSEITEALETSMQKAENELAAKQATKETIEALQATYDALCKKYGDPEILRAAYDDACTYYYAAVESDQEVVGYYKEGSTDAFVRVLDEIEPQITPDMTQEQYNTLFEKLNAAVAAFQASLILPEEDRLYFIISGEPNSDNFGRYLKADKNGTSLMGLSYNNEGTSELNPEMRLNYMWRFTKNSDGTYQARNAATGTYLGTTDKAGNDIYTSKTPVPFKFRSARAENYLNMELGEGLFAYSTPYYRNFTVAQNAEGQDGGAYLIEEADYQGTHSLRISSGLQVITLPFEIMAVTPDMSLYKVIGVKNNTVQCIAYNDSETIPAGCPFIVNNTEDIPEISIFLTELNNGTAINYSFEGLEQNGLTGAVNPTTINRPLCYLRGTVIDLAKATGTTIEANTGYFRLGGIPATDINGDIAIELTTSAVTDIATVNLNANDNTQPNAVYTITGQKIRSNGTLTGLPRGIYIVGGRKVIVK